MLALEMLFNGPHPDTALVHFNYGLMLAGTRCLPQAEEHVRTALRMQESIFGPQSPQLGRSLTSLGEVLMDQAKFTQARPVLQRAVWFGLWPSRTGQTLHLAPRRSPGSRA